MLSWNKLHVGFILPPTVTCISPMLFLLFSPLFLIYFFQQTHLTAVETNRAYLAKVGTRCQTLQCLFSQHQAGLLLTPWCHLCWLLLQFCCWQAAEGASGDVVKVLQLWGCLGSCVRISLLYLNVIFAWNNINYSDITSISAFTERGEEIMWVFFL